MGEEERQEVEKGKKKLILIVDPGGMRIIPYRKNSIM